MVYSTVRAARTVVGSSPRTFTNARRHVCRYVDQKVTVYKNNVIYTYYLTILPEGCDVASQFEREIKMCLKAYSAVYYDDNDYLENWVQPASNGMILDVNMQNEKFTEN